jgi:predicted phosphodiesterase
MERLTNSKLGLEEIVKMDNKNKRVMITSDYHIPYMDDKAYMVMRDFAKDYKPDHFVINGDFVDFYNLSTFDKSPDRKYGVVDEVRMARDVLGDLSKTLKSSCKKYFLEGNHENRLQKYLWKNPELEGLEELKLDRLLRFQESGFKYVNVNSDYWKTETGHLKLGNTIIMHGDNRLNGASTSKYSGYSVKNTMMGGTQMNTVVGHVHRLAMVYLSTPYDNFVGLESGCLCQRTGTANWQQGFVTFELEKQLIIEGSVPTLRSG